MAARRDAAANELLLLTSLALLTVAGADYSTDYYVLKHLYEVTDGANWRNNENWLTGEPCANSWASSSMYDCFTGKLVHTEQPLCCEATVDSEAAVIKIDLFDNNLQGEVPSELANLNNLRLLVLDSNSLSGTIPNLLGKLRYLEVLWLQDNSLSGSIPSELHTYITGDPGTCIIKPNLFNCSELNKDANSWCNASLAELFEDNMTPQGGGGEAYAAHEEGTGCIEDVAVEESDTSSTVSDSSDTEDEEASGLAAELATVIGIVLVAMSLVLLYEVVQRVQKYRQVRDGRMTEEQKEADAMRVQAERMGQMREMQLQQRREDAKIDAQIANEERRSSEGRSSLEGPSSQEGRSSQEPAEEEGKKARTKRTSVFARARRATCASSASRGSDTRRGSDGKSAPRNQPQCQSAPPTVSALRSLESMIEADSRASVSVEESQQSQAP